MRVSKPGQRNILQDRRTGGLSVRRRWKKGEDRRGEKKKGGKTADAHVQVSGTEDVTVERLEKPSDRSIVRNGIGSRENGTVL